MSIVPLRSHFSDSPDATCWQSVGGRVNVAGGSDDEDYGQFRRNGRRRDSRPSSLGSTPGASPPISPLPSHPKGLSGLSSGSPPKLAMTPAEFSLFPARSNGDARKPQNAELERQEECLAVNHLTTLRSAAFWELRRSVIENGEGLIRRMRDYELSRLHHQVCQKAKERKKRGRKSTLSSRCKTRPNVFEASDEDDVLICSEDTSNGLSWWSPLAGTRSLDSMDVDGQDQLGRRDSRSMPGADYSQAQFYYDMGMSFTRNSFETEEAKVDLESRLSYPDSASPTPSSSSISLLLPPSLSMTSEELLPLQTSSSEKALLELNVAFANGACSITDYSPVWRYQQQFNTDEHDNGDLWR